MNETKSMLALHQAVRDVLAEVSNWESGLAAARLIKLDMLKRLREAQLDAVVESEHLRLHSEMHDGLAASEAATVADVLLQQPEVLAALVERLVPLLAPKVTDAARNAFARELAAKLHFDEPPPKPKSPVEARAEVLRWMRELYVEDDDVRAGVGVGSPFDQAVCGFLAHLGAFVGVDDLHQDASWTIRFVHPEAPAQDAAASTATSPATQPQS